MRKQQSMYDISKAADRLPSGSVQSHHTLHKCREPCAEGCRDPWHRTDSVPWGNIKTWRTSQSRGGGTNPILKQPGPLSREVILESTWVGKKKERKLHSEYLLGQGHWTFWKVLGALNSHSAMITGLSNSARGTYELWYHMAQCWIWSGQKSLSFFLPATPLLIKVGAL